MDEFAMYGFQLLVKLPHGGLKVQLFRFSSKSDVALNNHEEVDNFLQGLDAHKQHVLLSIVHKCVKDPHMSLLCIRSDAVNGLLLIRVVYPGGGGGRGGLGGPHLWAATRTDNVAVQSLVRPAAAS